MSMDEDDDRDDGNEFREWRRQADIEADIAAHFYPDEEIPIFEPCRASTPCTTPIKPGSQHASQATKNGSEDDYSNRMAQRLGGEW